MVGIGQRIEIQGELYEVIRTAKAAVGKVLPTGFVEELKQHWHIDKIFKQGDVYYFVNEIKTIEPIEDEQDTDSGEATADSTENTSGGQMDVGGGEGSSEEHN